MWFSYCYLLRLFATLWLLMLLSCSVIMVYCLISCLRLQLTCCCLVVACATVYPLAVLAELLPFLVLHTWCDLHVGPLLLSACKYYTPKFNLECCCFYQLLMLLYVTLSESIDSDGSLLILMWSLDCCCFVLCLFVGFISWSTSYNFWWWCLAQIAFTCPVVYQPLWC